MVVTGVKGHNAKTGEEIELAADGVFIYVGLDPLNLNLSAKLWTHE